MDNEVPAFGRGKAGGYPVAGLGKGGVGGFPVEDAAICAVGVDGWHVYIAEWTEEETRGEDGVSVVAWEVCFLWYICLLAIHS